MKLTKSKLKEIIREELNEAKLKDIVPDIIFTAAQYTSKKLDHIARQSWDSSHELTKQIMQNIPMSKWNPFQRDVKKLLKKHSIREGMLNEAKREIGGYYLMKQVKDWITDAKSDRETKLVNALQYLYKELEKNRDIELNIDDINYFLNTSNGKKHKKNISTKMINSLFEGKLNEKKWDITQRTRDGADFGSSIAFHARNLEKTVSVYKNKHKVNPEEMKYYMNRWMTGLHKRLKSYGVL